MGVFNNIFQKNVHGDGFKFPTIYVNKKNTIKIVFNCHTDDIVAVVVSFMVTVWHEN